MSLPPLPAARKSAAVLPFKSRRSYKTPLQLVSIWGAIVCGAAHLGYAQFLGQKTYCNPVDINYQYKVFCRFCALKHA